MTTDGVSTMTKDYITIKSSVYESLKQENQHLIAELQRTQQLFQLVIENIPHSVFWKDINLTYLGCNRNFAKGAGVKHPQDIVGKNDYDLPWKKDKADFCQEYEKRVMESGIPEINLIETQLQVDGNQFWFDTNKIPLRDDEGNLIGILGIYENISKQKQVEKTLKKLNETLEARVEKLTTQLWETQTRLSLLADSVAGVIYQFQQNSDGTVFFPYVSSGCRDIWEIEIYQVYQNSDFLFQMIHPEDLLEFNQSIIKSAQTLENWHHEWRMTTPSGKHKWLKGISKPRLQLDNSIIWDGCIIDITQRKKNEDALQKLNQELELRVEQRTAALHKTEARLQKLTDNVPGMIYEFSLAPDGTMSFPYLSSGCWEIFELEKLEKNKNGKLLFSAVHPDDFVGFQESITNSANTLTNWKYRWRSITKNNQYKWLKGISKPEVQPDGSILWYGCVIDITELKKTEEELKTSQHFIQKITKSSPSIIYIFDLEKQHNVYTNHELSELLGYSIKDIEIFGKNYLAKIIHPEDLKIISYAQEKILAASDGDILEFEYRIKHSDGNYRWIYDRQTIFSRRKDGTVKEFLGVVADINKRKCAEIQARQKAIELEHTLQKLQQTQAQLIQTEKMSSLGQMVAGVAHEINNPVNFIHANLSFIQDYTQDLLGLLDIYEEHYPNPEKKVQQEIENIELDYLKEDLQKILYSMEEGTRRIREIVLSLRNFSRLDEAEFKKVDIHEGIDSTLMILQNRFRSKSNFPGIEIIKKYANLPLIECYPSQLNQVFMNILVNAIDALEEKVNNLINFTPKITITTKQLTNTSVQINISDNAYGIPQNIMSKLFDPFFTTKKVGKGTGLGLSVSYQIIVDKHGGKLFLSSIPGEGTSFIIDIPINHPC